VTVAWSNWIWCIAIGACASSRSPAGAQPAPAPTPYGATPSPRHLLWHELELYGFVHFTTNTFTDKEWGYGDESPGVFNPTEFDADQIVSVAAEAGMRGLILTCKHHDGFCLWPSGLTEHDVASSPWRGGEGDVVREVSEACARRGLKFGVYLSPWDRNHPEYGREKYVEYYRGQLRELLTGYGPIFEVWWDGANGGDGYYGGARETRRIDPSTYYGWEETTRLVRELQPEAVIFSDAGDIRWVGNESGIAGDPCWATYSPRPRDGESRAGPGTTRWWEGTSGHRDGPLWMPAECDVSIRPGWFYHASEDARVKSPEQLVDLYYASVGRGASLLLNIPPDTRGRIHERDRASLMGFRAILDETFDENVAAGAVAWASDVRGDDPAYAPALVLDGDPETYWATGDAVREAELVLDLPEPAWFNVVSLRECLPLGQRIDTWALDAWRDGRWVELASGEAIGARRLWRGEPVMSERLRVRVRGSASPAVSEVGLYAEPSAVSIDTPSETFVDSVVVTLRPDRPDATIRYTTDGSEPNGESPVYHGPLTLTRSAVVRAAAEVEGRLSPRTAERTFTAYPRESLRAPVSLLREPPPGVHAEYYEGRWRSLDQRRGASPLRSRSVNGLSTDVRERDEHFAIVFSGFILAPRDGVYEFTTRSDDGSRVYLHDEIVVDNDGLHGMTERSGAVGLQAGYHPFRVEYFNATGQLGLEVLWATPGSPKAPIPPDALFGGG